MAKIQPKPAAASRKAASSGTAAPVPSQLAASSRVYPMASSSRGFVGSRAASPSVLGVTGSYASSFPALPTSATGGSISSTDVDVLHAAASFGLATPPVGFTAAADGRGGLRLVEKLVLELVDIDRRENALSVLSKKKEIFQDLAPLLWFSFGTITILLQELVLIYDVLSPPSLTLAQSNRACNALALLQCVASHPDTRKFFVLAWIPFYLFPLIETTSKSMPFEHLRLASLGVIGALVKVPDTDAVFYLLKSEIMPLLLRAMEIGNELTKTVATFIVQRMLLDDVGLEYMCCVPERRLALSRALATVVAALARQPSARLLKHVIKCYICFSQDERSLQVLRYLLPKSLTDGTFDRFLREDQTMRMWLQQLADNVKKPPVIQQANIACDCPIRVQ